MNITPSWDDIEIATKSLVDLMLSDGFVPEYVIGLSRGGLTPAVIASQMMNIPLISVSYSSKIGVGDQRNHENFLPDVGEDLKVGTGILKPPVVIIDDIIDSGHTMVEVNTHYVGHGHQVCTMAIYHKESSVFVPDFSYYRLPKDAPFINFPWER